MFKKDWEVLKNSRELSRTVLSNGLKGDGETVPTRVGSYFTRSLFMGTSV